MGGQNRCAFFEGLGEPINAALALGKKHKNFTAAQAVGAGAQGGDQVGIGINHADLEQPGNPSADAGTKNLAGPYGEAVAK